MADDGGLFNEWQSTLGNVAGEFLAGPVATETMNYLQDKFEEYIGDSHNWEEIAKQAPGVAQYIANLIASELSAVVGMVIAVAALLFFGLLSGKSDDFYGIDVFTLALPTNIADYIHGLPGQHTAQGFRLDSKPFTLKGSTSWPEAASYDGMVEIHYHFYFADIDTY